MATFALTSRIPLASAQIFGVVVVLGCALLAVAVGMFPLGASIVTVFLFAGLHNIFEFRYFIARMPLRWGKSAGFYSVGLGGVLVLAICYLAIYFSSGAWPWSSSSWEIALASWNSVFVIWIATLFYLRGRHRRGRDWSWGFSIAFALAALAWLVPAFWSLALVYIHPLIAMWFLERQIRRSKRDWLRAYHLCLASIPVFIAALYFAFSSSESLNSDTNLFWRITQHAGSEILPGLSSHFLVATHVFLESIHYSVWLLMLPLVDRRAVPWRLSEVPMYASPKGFPKIFTACIAVGILMVVALWLGFTVDYLWMRDVYFAVAIGHVLAEFPFLIKML